MHPSEGRPLAAPAPRAGRLGIRGGRRLLAVLLVALSGLGGVAVAGDAELAEFLLKGGRDDFAKKQYDEALKKLAKARVEDPTRIEATFWIGAVHDARKDPRAAATAYKEFRRAYDEKKAGAGVSKEEEGLLPRAQARLDVLAAGETELARVQDAYVAQLLALAEENFIRDPEVTTRALGMLLDVRPGHEPARRLLEKLGGAAGASEVAAATDPFGVKAWEDMIGLKRFSAADGFEYGDGGTMAFERREGKLITPPRMDPTTTRYVIDVEVRFTEDFGNRVFGIGYGHKNGRVFCAMLTPAKVDFVDIGAGRGSQSTIATHHLAKEIPVGEWHRMTLIVDGLRMELHIDGKKELEGTAAGRDDLDGMIAAYGQQCRVEVRRFRLGRRS